MADKHSISDGYNQMKTYNSSRYIVPCSYIRSKSYDYETTYFEHSEDVSLILITSIPSNLKGQNEMVISQIITGNLVTAVEVYNTGLNP